MDATSPLSRLNSETVLIPVDRGRFVDVHPPSALSLHLEVAPPQNVEVENAVKFGVFRHSGARQ